MQVCPRHLPIATRTIWGCNLRTKSHVDLFAEGSMIVLLGFHRDLAPATDQALR